jgi:hypothetical protein
VKYIILVFTIIFSASTLADYRIQFASSQIKIPKKTIPSIEEITNYSSSYNSVQNLSSIEDDLIFNFAYSHTTEGYGEVVLKFDDDVLINGIEIYNVSCDFYVPYGSGSKIYGIIMNLENLSAPLNRFYQRHYQYQSGYDYDKNERYYYDENGNELRESGIGGYPIRLKSRYTIDDKFSSLVDHYIPFVEPMNIKKEDGLKIRVDNVRSGSGTHLSECSMSFKFTAETN